MLFPKRNLISIIAIGAAGFFIIAGCGIGDPNSDNSGAPDWASTNAQSLSKTGTTSKITSKTPLVCSFSKTVHSTLNKLDDLVGLQGISGDNRLVLGAYPVHAPGIAVMRNTVGGATFKAQTSTNSTRTKSTVEFFVHTRTSATDSAHAPIPYGKGGAVADAMNEIIPKLFPTAEPGISKEWMPNVPCGPYTMDICDVWIDSFCEAVEIRESAVAGFFAGTSSYDSVVRCKMHVPCMDGLRKDIPISLRASNGQYVVAEGGGGRELKANRNYVGPWETFRLQALGNGKIALRAHKGQYVTAQSGGGGMVNATSNSIGSNETFELMTNSLSAMEIDSVNGQPLMAMGGGGSYLLAYPTKYTAAKQFRMSFLLNHL